MANDNYIKIKDRLKHLEVKVFKEETTNYEIITIKSTRGSLTSTVANALFEIGYTCWIIENNSIVITEPRKEDN